MRNNIPEDKGRLPASNIIASICTFDPNSTKFTFPPALPLYIPFKVSLFFALGRCACEITVSLLEAVKAVRAFTNWASEFSAPAFDILEYKGTVWCWTEWEPGCAMNIAACNEMYGHSLTIIRRTPTDEKEHEDKPHVAREQVYTDHVVWKSPHHSQDQDREQESWKYFRPEEHKARACLPENFLPLFSHVLWGRQHGSCTR